MSTLFPYTTLFRSDERDARLVASLHAESGTAMKLAEVHATLAVAQQLRALRQDVYPAAARQRGSRRSEEHTSELQSHVNLVCRLLLEKKKKQNNINNVEYNTQLIINQQPQASEIRIIDHRNTTELPLSRLLY